MNKQVKQSIILSLALLLAIVQGAQAQESIVQGAQAQEFITVYADNDTQTNWAEFNGQEVSSFTIHNRILYKDGKWNTLCLPFDLTIAGSVLNGADVRTLSSSSFKSSTGELTLNFTPALDETGAVTIKAGVPYIISWAEDSDLETLNFGTDAVTLNTTLHHVATDWVDFVGTYSPCDITTEDKSVLYLGDDNTLYYPSSAMTIGLCRAYFRLKKGLTAGETTSGNPNHPIKSFVLNFGDDADGIHSPTPVRLSSGPKSDPSRDGVERAGAWYDLSGRKISPSSARSNGTLDTSRILTHQWPRGIYINDGKKVVIK